MPTSDGITVASRFRLLDLIAEGAMGQVWDAEDLQLQRRVAVKLIAEHLTRDHEAVERMFREARAAAGVDHPGVVAIYEVGFEDRRAYIVMQKVEGVSLRQQLDCTAFTIPDALDVIRGVAEALAEVHAVGIVHRDLKPANIMMTTRGPKIVDFGLASLRGSPRLTLEGAVLGTPLTMSPEQFRGHECDHRADLWALGCILYETLARQLPFNGNTFQALMNAVLNDQPPSPSSVRPEVPKELDFLVMKLLRKDTALRYSQAEDFLADLRSVEQQLFAGAATTGSSPVGPTRLAVAYMEAPNADARADGLALGISEGLMVELTRDHRLMIAGRTEVAAVKNRVTSARAIARELGVDYVLVGLIRASGSRLRANAQLIRATDGQAIWAERYDRSLDSVDSFEIEEDLVGAMSGAVRGALLASSDGGFDYIPTGPSASQTLLRRARDYVDLGDRVSNERAEVLLRMAMSRTPADILILAALAECYAIRLVSGWGGLEMAELAEQYAALALSGAETIPEAHLARAAVAMWRDDVSMARVALVGLWDSVPMRIATLENGAICSIAVDRPGDVFKALRPQVDRHLGRGEIAEMLALACEILGRDADADQFWMQARDGFMMQIRARSDDAIARARLAGALARTADASRALSHLHRAIESGRIEPSLAYHAGCAHATLGRVAEAVGLLEFAVQELPVRARKRLSRDPRLRSLHNEPGFAALLP